MASRRDQLNAYTFARKRTVAAFLQPSAASSEEGAPRPLRAVVPGLAVAGLLLAGVGAWGLVKPGAPVGWDKAPYSHVLVGSESTTRYVILKSGGRPELHPVLNLASAKLLLGPDNFSVLKIDESLLDRSALRHGPTIGIPYAPDRLPAPGDAGSAKHWAVCEQQGIGAEAQKAAFVLAKREWNAVEGAGRLRGGQVLYVQGPDGTPYLVDAAGTGYPVDTGAVTGADGSPAAAGLLRSSLFGQARPQQVTADWLATLTPGPVIGFPSVPGFGQPAGVRGLAASVDRVGMVITPSSGDTRQRYVVLKGKVAPVSGLVAHLLLTYPGVQGYYPGQLPKAQPVAMNDIVPSDTAFLAGNGWPRRAPTRTGIRSGGTVCGVYRGTMRQGRPVLSVWAGPSYPHTFGDGGASAYVTPGSGLLYRQVTGAGDSGPVYLVTDTGLRYRLSGTDHSAARLGYGGVKPVVVPENWSAFVPVGPTLDVQHARQEQGS